MKKAISKAALLALPLFCTFGSSATAQQPEKNKQHQKLNNITVHTSAYYCLTNDYYRHNHAHDFSALIGIQYQHTVWHEFFVFANYTFTTNQPDFTIGIQPYSFSMPAGEPDWWHKQHGINYYNPVGHLTSRRNYHFFDLGIGYHYYTVNKKHKLSASIGLSYATGNNEYITELRWAPPMPEGMGDLVNYESELRRENYWGTVLTVGYDYLLWENRINVGVDASLRKYERNFPLFTNYGLHAGFNF